MGKSFEGVISHLCQFSMEGRGGQVRGFHRLGFFICYIRVASILSLNSRWSRCTIILDQRFFVCGDKFILLEISACFINYVGEGDDQGKYY